MFRLITIIILTSLFLSCAYANETDFYTEHSEGWHWYQDPQKLSKQTAKQNNGKAVDPVKAMKQLHKMLNAALDRAILFPTDQNVKNYMALQNLVTQRAAVFTAKWKQVLLNDPKLDYSVKHPTSSIGREIYLNQYRQKEDNAIHEFAQHEGLFFFYRGDCPYCHRFAPILKEFSEKYNIRVIPITLGAGFLPEFPNSRVDHGQAALLHVQVYPSLFAVNPKNKKIIPVAYGLMSEQALRQRILNIETHFRGDE